MSKAGHVNRIRHWAAWNPRTGVTSVAPSTPGSSIRRERRIVMRLIPLVALSVLYVSTPAMAQEWIEYASRADMFTVNFPGQPTVQDINWETEYRITIPGHVHKYDAKQEHYSVTVVD